MKTFNVRNRIRFAAVLSGLLATSAFAGSAGIASAVAGEELAVWSVMATAIAADSADHPYKLWYFKSDFSAANNVSIALDDPDREEFCGLSGQDSLAMIEQLKALGAAPVAVDESIAESAGFRLARRKNPQLRYFAMSRVVFSPALDSAWLSIELNGERGSIARLEKIDGEWRRTSRCAAWYMPDGNPQNEAPELESRVSGHRRRLRPTGRRRATNPDPAEIFFSMAPQDVDKAVTKNTTSSRASVRA
jgi:hypothetical protein